MITIYGAADIASALGVKLTAFSNWLARHGDTPAPAYVTPNGRQYWVDVDAWRSWHEGRQK